MSRDPSNQRITEKVHFEISKSTLSSLGRWLLVSPLILVILLASGQLALMVPTGMAADDISSKLTANYLPWERVVIPALKPQLLNELLAEEGLPARVVESGAYWPDLPQATPVAMLPTLTPSATREPQDPTSTSLPGLTFSPTVSPTRAPASHTPTWTAVPTRTTYYVPPPTYTRTPTRTHKPPTATRTRTPSPTSTRTQTVTASVTPSATGTATRTPTPSLSPTVTRTPTSTATFTPTSTSTVTQTPTQTGTFTPTSTNTSTLTPTETETLTPTPTDTATLTPTETETPTPTLTPTETETVMPTDTYTPTSTPVDTPTPTQMPPPQDVEVGPPNYVPNNLTCGNAIVVDLGAPTYVGTLVYYEYLNPAGCGGGVCMDSVIIDLGNSGLGPWDPYFYWGDSNGSNNGNIQPYHFSSGVELDNEIIPLAELYNTEGILIPVGSTYRYVRISAPPGCGDETQIDAIDVLP